MKSVNNFFFRKSYNNQYTTFQSIISQKSLNVRAADSSCATKSFQAFKQGSFLVNFIKLHNLIPEADKDSNIFNKEGDKLVFSKYIVWKIS